MSETGMQVLPLGDGRNLAYQVFGDPAGLPVYYCHGFPGSRAEAALADRAAKELGVRLIAPDRPGFGGSTAAPHRRLEDWPQDLHALATSLQTDRYHLLAVSGGAPYALACAARLGESLRGATLVCGLGQLYDATDVQAMSPFAARSIGLYRRLPRIGEWLYGRLLGPLLGRYPEWIFRIIAGHAPAADRQVLAQAAVRSVLTRSFREAFRGGGRGPARELTRYLLPWTIDLSRIAIPVSVWHGESDTTVPLTMGQRQAAAIPDCRSHWLPNEGHFSLIVRYMHDILEELTAF